MGEVNAKQAWDDYLDQAESIAFSEVRDSGPFGQVEIRREPAGVVLIVMTYNGPVTHVGLKVVPALLSGCCVIMKPAPETQLVAHLLGEACDAAGLPPGVISILPAETEVSQHLVAHPGVDMVNFTGGTVIGAEVMRACAGRLAKVTLELGGKSPAIIADDVDTETLVAQLLPGMVTFQGQICTTLTRILVPDKRHDELVSAIGSGLEALKIGDPADPSIEWGPLAVKRARDRAESYVARAQEQGASIATGGGAPAEFPDGWYFEPTLLVDVDNSTTVAQEEVFGPVYSVIRYRGIENAIDIANDTRYGLAGSVFTTDLELARRVAQRVRTGTFAINTAGAALNQPFGGYKQSGVGREGGLEGMLEYTEIKATMLNDAADAKVGE
jgi:acyl-CoA reductase-like NAD-dependent aldehyde dehydrogenase